MTLDAQKEMFLKKQSSKCESQNNTSRCKPSPKTIVNDFESSSTIY
jgi:hypothetical protein